MPTSKDIDYNTHGTFWQHTIFIVAVHVENCHQAACGCLK